MARVISPRWRILKYGLLAGVSLGVVSLSACAVQKLTPGTYVICNSTGCGDKVDVVINNDLAPHK